ncbi:methyltetrahydrofolate cobalamin methyltransferase [Sporomusa sp. KB1]|jgi:5-methyltetrahydrofolate--homocysteine methyltransferase|uniref:methyltetrahydrofolate cobalamin methyltransferase n=1 Tax=Sporomusa sp. KB1 TaxID=943346 RepID=UPI0011A67C2C|nr:methyltetrahydrofolate cobalamin methyltransferase [Sporomusa sp. KB1]TWH45119.1 5-methyltetrahydrofolate--homocysteine methyltransferase [Sporomusa sp. KB1]
MIIVGELINASRKPIQEAIKSGDASYIQQVAKNEHEAGANYIDVNAGVFVGQEADYLKWMVKLVQEVVEGPCCIDSPDPRAIEAALSVHKGPAMLNSISLEKERYDVFIPLVAGSDHKVVALCMSDEGMPESAEARVKIADELINRLVKKGLSLDQIYVDPLVQPLSTNDIYGVEFLKAIEMIMNNYPGVHTMCGLSNISFGLPMRKFLNRTFGIMAIDRGLDGMIMNPLDKEFMVSIIAAEALRGKDCYCSSYLQAYRDKLFEF